MGLFTNPFKKKNQVILQDDNVDKYLQAFLQWIGANYTQYDTNLQTYVIEGLLKNPDVYSIIHQQSTKHSNIPKKIIDGENEKDFPLARPNSMQTWGQLRYLEKQFLKSTGNIFLYTPSATDGLNSGVPKACWVLPSHMMKIVIKKDFDLRDYEESPISHYMLIEGRVYTEFPADQVIHIAYPNPNYDLNGSHLYGLSPLRPLLRNIQSSNLAIDGNVKAMLNSGIFGFLHGKGDNVLQDEQAKALKSRMKEMEAGEQRLHRIGVASQEIGYTQVGLTPDKLMPFEFLKFDQKQLCNALTWSDKLLNNDDGGKYDNVSQFRKQVVTDNLMPDNNLIDEAYTNRFIRKFKGYENSTQVSVYDDLPEMQENMKEKAEWVNSMVDRGIFSRNMALEEMGKERINDPNMDILTVKDDVIPLNEAIIEDPNVQTGIQA